MILDKNYLPPELAAQLLERDSRQDAMVQNFGKPALCQCTKCLRYLAQDRLDDASFINNMCVECTTNGIPLAKIRGPEGLTPAQIELLGLLTEECGEVSQRVGKILRWGLDADFHGSTQAEKLETELGDVLAVIVLAMHNRIINAHSLFERFESKMEKFIADANGPRQRIGRASVPNDGEYYLDMGIRMTEESK